MDKERLEKSTTTSGRPPEPGLEDAAAPEGIDPKTGQHKSYWVLSEEERGGGFVRPVRHTYVHVGQNPQNPLRDLTIDEQERYAKYNYVKFEAYPDGSSVTGRYWTQKQLDASGCGTVTTMSDALAETYARDPNYYGSTFCAGCKTHFPVWEFKWDDGSDTIVGS